MRAGLADSRLGHAVLLDESRKDRLALGKRLGVSSDAVPRPDHQAMLAA
jgi:hypothetical protein